MTPSLFLSSAILPHINYWLTFRNNDIIQYREPITVVGRGWFYKGFSDHINYNKYKITNIYENDLVNISALLPNILNDDLSVYNINNIEIYDNIRTTKIKGTIEEIDTYKRIISFVNNKPSDHIYNKLIIGLNNETSNSDWCEKINRIKSLIKKDKKNLAIVGTDRIGTELAFSLNDKGCKITMYEELKESHKYLSPRLRQYILKKFATNNIQINFNQYYTKDLDDKYDDTIFINKNPNKSINKHMLDHGRIYTYGDCTDLHFYEQNPQTAYEQGKNIALRLNDGVSYHHKSIFIHSIYVGDNLYAFYMKDYDYFILVPKYFIDKYYKYFT